MNKILFGLFILATAGLSAQDYYVEKTTSKHTYEETSCITAGILQGGGSLVGADLEVLLSKRFGAQIGAGLVGFGGGLNFHLKPGIRSSMISLQYWNQGIGNSFTQSLVGPNFVYRSKKWFTFQIGIGAILEVNEENSVYDDGRVPDAILTYAIGAYFPW
jgi:hypothetical protein